MMSGGLSSLKAGHTCLVVLSSAGSVDITGYSGSVSGRSVRDAVEVLRGQSVRVAVATPNGAEAEMHADSDDTATWLRDPANRQLLSSPLSVAELLKQDNIVMGYWGLVLPSSLGGVSDLAHDAALGNLVKKFVAANKPICAVGYGVTGLCKAFSDSDKWCFSGWNLTAVSNFEVARYPFFSKLPLIIEDFVKDHGGFYNCSVVDAVHVVVDRSLITGQNDNSTALAVQNFVWLCQRSPTQ